MSALILPKRLVYKTIEKEGENCLLKSVICIIFGLDEAILDIQWRLCLHNWAHINRSIVSESCLRSRMKHYNDIA